MAAREIEAGFHITLSPVASDTGFLLSPVTVGIRGRCRKHFFQILSRHMFFFVFLNFKRGFFS